MLKAILFDMDDTLIDWSARRTDWREYDRRSFTRLHGYLAEHLGLSDGAQAFVEGLEMQFERERLMAGESLRAVHMINLMHRMLSGMGAGDLSREAFRELLEGYAGWGLMPGVVPFPDVLAVLPELRAAGLALGIVTNAWLPMWLRDRELQAAGLLSFFPCRVAAADVGYVKPHPVIFERALDCLGVQPEEAIMIGDWPTADIIGAQYLGMRGVLRTREDFSPVQTGEFIPDAVIDTLHELPPLLDRWYPEWRNNNSGA